MAGVVHNGADDSDVDVTGDWSTGIIGRTVSDSTVAGSTVALVPLSMDFGYAWNETAILYNVIIGFSSGLFLDFCLSIMLWLGGGYTARRMIQLIDAA